MYCTQCGGVVPANASFCTQCGQAVKPSAPIPPSPVVPVAETPGRTPSYHDDQPYFVLASIRRRWMAMIVDQLLVVGAFFAFAFAVGMFGNGNDSLGGILFLCWLAGMWLYFAAFLAFAQGATPGKKLLKIKVTRTSGGGVSFGRATARFFGRLIPFGLFFALFNDRKQCLHDLIADTIVVPTDGAVGAGSP